MTLIFRTIFGNFLERFTAECKALVDAVVAATIGMYNTILRDLRPTPAKTHYTYNLRDLSKVFQVRSGVFMRVLPLNGGGALNAPGGTRYRARGNPQMVLDWKHDPKDLRGGLRV